MEVENEIRQIKLARTRAVSTAVLFILPVSAKNPLRIFCSAPSTRTVREPVMLSLNLPEICELSSLTSPLSVRNLRSNNAALSAMTGTMTMTHKASFQSLINMMTAAPIRYDKFHTPLMKSQATTPPIRLVSLMIRECRYPTLFWLKNEKDSVCRCLKHAPRISLAISTSILPVW